ncbi:putative DNA polymerase gamma [Clavispora lusitaniae]|uniref:DNA polymerase gamma n=1 Tax=Clavispora lusitaniae TaxID=36911 RepID=A0ACD0WT26_CLALS|nr:putative DNA polymerase gamma [Clavispora lusitaniae]QFZ36132.1 putative DNA polymerase gamma [Clavispora lusitaniae]QFZ41816.1 putative DNA polymerase gamma [Clavispora lusitaniae]QFZ47492.1 putative DNA polymerase gamma [Clavispora lusitaniae]QFZ53171.1 putative DNA polymerase gamma [Clavispora lusitaniae]
MLRQLLLKRCFCISHQLLQEPRVNQLGIQYLSHDLHKKVFPKSSSQSYLSPPHPALLQLAKSHLAHNGLLGKKTQIGAPLHIENMPDLVGNSSLDEHFSRIANRYAQPYTAMAETLFASALPKRPDSWLLQSGWTRYAPGKEPQPVSCPLENEIVFDVEVLYKRSPYALMCTAVTPKAWYGWVSPVLLHHKDPNLDWDHLIPFDTHAAPKLLVGFNVSYDRARILEEYSIKQSKAFFLDAMALHISLSGFCSQQRPTWNKHKKHKSEAEKETEVDPEEESSMVRDDFSAAEVAQELLDDPWLSKGAPNSLANVAEFHCGIKMDKDLRDTFSSTNVEDVVSDFQNLMHYCASDVEATFAVAQKLYPQFRAKTPHPVSFAALKSLGSLVLPTTKKWNNYIESAEKVYDENRNAVSSILKERANELIRFIEEQNDSLKPDYESDPWLKQLNWTLKAQRLKKDGSPYAKQAFLTGYPEWYRDLFKTSSETGQKEMNLSVRSRITPLLLRLKWEGNPLIWTESAGWCFKVPFTDEKVDEMLSKNYTKAQLSEEDFESLLPELRDGDQPYELFKVPHPDGPKKRCTLIMSKSYLRYFESGVLTSEYDYAKEILNLNATASYWMGNRARILDQFVVFADPKAEKNNFFGTKKQSKEHKDMGIILPKLCTMGTITRRATENTWLTASNSKANRIGSELKSLIEAPKGYVFVGADVDSEELWIASLIGDSMFKIHGGTALGWMTLEGDKNQKTDLHSKTADIMGISRNDAKVFNYGRIYGAGVKFATRLLKQCNANLSDAEAERLAKELYEKTKGLASHSKIFKRGVYHGGSESVMFNALEAIAYQEHPRTPVLGASITDALTQKYLNKNNYLTSRINWTIQSSGVDYLHLLIVSMDYLIEKFKLDARLMITVHDEVRYMVKEEQRLMCALLLQISNLWTRAMFCEQLGIKELPQSCAFFSEVDIDFVLRKEVGTECITPSHPNPIAPGESYDIIKLLDSFDYASALAERKSSLTNIKSFNYRSRRPVIESLDDEANTDVKIGKLRLQNSVTKDEWKANVGNLMRQSRLYMEAPIQPSKPEKTAKPRSKRKNDVDSNSPKDAKAQKPNSDKKFSKPMKPKRQVDEDDYFMSQDGDEVLRREIEESIAKSGKSWPSMGSSAFKNDPMSTWTGESIIFRTKSKQTGLNRVPVAKYSSLNLSGSSRNGPIATYNMFSTRKVNKPSHNLTSDNSAADEKKFDSNFKRRSQAELKGDVRRRRRRT